MNVSELINFIKSKKKGLNKKGGIIKSKTKFKATNVFNNKDSHFFVFKSNDTRFNSCSIKYKYETEKLNEVKSVVAETNKKPNKRLSLIFVIINIIILGIVLYTSLSGDDGLSLTEALELIKWPFLGIALAMLVLSLIIDASKFVLLIYQSTRRFRPFLAFKTMALGRYYDNITPSSTGGQPFQIYYLNKRGIKGEVATSVPLMKYICWQIGFVITSFIFLMLNYKYLMTQNSLIVTLAWVGFGMNALLLVAVLLLSTSKKIGPAVIVWFLKLLNRMKLIKNYRATFSKTMRFVVSYQRCMREFTSNIFYFLLQILLAGAEIICNASIAYFVYLAFIQDDPASFSLVISITLLCNLAVCFIPVPGQAGAAEISFISVYGNLFTSIGHKVGSIAVVFYRLFTYYSMLLLGIGVILYDFFIGNKRAEKYRKTHLFSDGFVFKKKIRKRKIK